MKIIFYGFGEINRLIAKKALQRNYNIIGAVDIKPDLIIHATSSFLNLTYPQIFISCKLR
jgi:glyceraldehyde-3-phosphate dehydrogenase/erythrose-4-phosphate dehydrogenase